MNEMHAVVGYLPDAVAKKWASGGQQKQALEVRMEPGSDEMHVTISPTDVTGVLLGASQKGETSVQVFVKKSAQVSTVARGVASDLVLRPIRDLGFFRSRAAISVIFADARMVDKLVQLNREGLK
jgi:hypothetical protein